MDIAGHSTIEMTMNVYGHVTLDEKREALDKLGTLFEEESDRVAVLVAVNAGGAPTGAATQMAGKHESPGQRGI